jgi:SAM-dependent methyltransferase
MSEREPMRREMADPSMLRCLEAQAEAIWPQERELMRRYGLDPQARVLEVGCGSGEFVDRFASEYPEAEIAGIDLIESHLELAREKCAAHGARVRFSVGDALALDFPAATFDLVVCRHMLQTVTDPVAVVAEMTRVTRPGGRLHLLAEDYGMIQFHPVAPGVERFFLDGAIRFGEALGTDLAIGRKVFTILHDLGLRDIGVDYVTVDTQRVPREIFVQIWEAWRDGFTDVIVEKTELSRERVAAAWESMISCLRDPRGYAVWQVPLLNARVAAAQGLR